MPEQMYYLEPAGREAGKRAAEPHRRVTNPDITKRVRCKGFLQLVKITIAFQ